TLIAHAEKERRALQVALERTVIRWRYLLGAHPSIRSAGTRSKHSAQMPSLVSVPTCTLGSGRSSDSQSWRTCSPRSMSDGSSLLAHLWTFATVAEGEKVFSSVCAL